jgi:hypothetical protein
MNTTKLSTLGRGARHTNRATRANELRALGQANLEAAFADAPVLIAELRAHGCMSRACAVAGVSIQRFQIMRRRDRTLSRQARLAVEFAASDAVDYSKWSVTQ